MSKQFQIFSVITNVINTHSKKTKQKHNTIYSKLTCLPLPHKTVQATVPEPLRP